MSDDVAFYAPTSPRHYRGNRNQASCCSSPTESGITRVGAAELRDHGETYGLEEQFYQNEELLIGRPGSIAG